MLVHFLRIGFLLLTISKSLVQTSDVESPTYIGAVVEYHPLSDGVDLRAILESNANNYQTIIKKAAEYKVDIIVFPEYGLTRLPREGNFEDRYDASKFRAYYQDTASYVPHPNEMVVLCDSDAKYAKSLQIISCAARDYGMYVVVNHHERADCPKPNCSPDNFLLYNTNVVFDRKGKVIARYRKSTLYKEDGTNVIKPPEHSIFSTDFGVTFGQFICADILYDKPANFYARNPEVTDVVFPTRWYSESSFFDATEIQAAWAHTADVNFLASCYSKVSSCSGGSGIYAGKSGPIRVYRKFESSNALVIAEIPKLNRHNRVDVRSANSTVYEFSRAELLTATSPPVDQINGTTCLYREDLRIYTTQTLDPSQGTHIATICDRGLCCDFHVEMSHNAKLTANPGAKQYRYRLVVFNGVMQLDINQPTAGLEVCALLNCVNDGLEHCEVSPGVEEKSTTRIESLTISRRANMHDRSIYMPMTLTREYVPLVESDFVYLASGHRNSSLLVMHLMRPRGDLLTFGIFGRRFDRDGQAVTQLSAGDESICHTDGCN